MRPLKVGLFLPVDRPWSELGQMAETAEAVGFDSVWIMDHLLFRNDEGESGAWECFSLIAAIAAATRRLEIGTLVACMPFRNPALLAKIVDTIEEISGGRLIVGLGAGWHEPEFRAFGYPFDHRASRFEEAFAILRGLLREGRVDFEGRFHQAPDCVLLPRGPRPKGPPLMIGTRGERMLRLTAEHADLWNGCWFRDPSEVASQLSLVDAACAAVGREPSSLGRTGGVRLDLPGRTGKGVGSPAPLIESPAQAADLLRGYAAAGLPHLQLRLDPMTLASVEALAPALELLDRS
ncbi:MAG TPA: LLM class flavin-dependent oxidoreductase [Chloroflexota bacterium]|jgi:probable F420-dependent oxidoreductase